MTNCRFLNTNLHPTDREVFSTVWEKEAGVGGLPWKVKIVNTDATEEATAPDKRASKRVRALSTREQREREG